jgi:hypothetical protein
MISHIIARAGAFVTFTLASVNYLLDNNSAAEFFMLGAIFWAVISVLLVVESGVK